MRALRRVDPIAWALLALALAVRVAVVLATSGDVAAVADPGDYVRHAESIAAGDGYPQSTLPAGGETAYRPPAYPALLGLLFALGGDSWTLARLAQALVGTLAVALVGLIAAKLWDRRTALVAMAIAAVYLPLAVAGASFLTELLLIPLVLGAVGAVLHARDVPSPMPWIALAGVLAGLATLTRTNAALILLGLGIGAWAMTRRRRAPVVLVLAACLTVAPWTVRNAIVLDAFVPVSTQDGYTLAGTYNDLARDQPREPAAWVEWYRVPEFAEAARTQREVELGDLLRERAVSYARDHLPYVGEVVWWNARRLVHLSGLDFVRFDMAVNALPGWLGVAAAIAFWLLVPPAAVGAVLAWRRRAAPAWLWLVPFVLLATLPIVAAARFRWPIDPFLVLLAAYAVAGAGRRATRRAPAAVA